MEPHAMAPQDNKPQKSPFAKLFSSDSQADKHLQKIRDKIYSFAWSRDRRDEAKFDWVLSENGINRNVPSRWWRQASPGSNRDATDALSCWLLLANKRISADFIRFIYSVNHLDILVDLKGNDTELNRAKLDKIVDLLHNANFQRYTRSARVRIHFPDKYPFQDLPSFNQHTLDNIAWALDRFHQLTYLSVRVVPMQGPEVYELRLAAFAFYPMSMTNWSIRMLNSKTNSWDGVGGEQIHHLNLAWDLFQETGSLTAAVHAPIAEEKPTVHNDRTPQAQGADDARKDLAVGQKKNGSHKRKGRKLRALSAATESTATKPTSEDVSSADLSLRPSSPSLDHSKGARSISVSVHDSGSSITEMPLRSAGEPPDTRSPNSDDAEAARQRASSSSLGKRESSSAAECDPAHEVSDEAAAIEDTADQHPGPASPIETATDGSLNQQKPQKASPSSSAKSSVTLGRDQSDDGNEMNGTDEESPQVETTMRGAGADSEKPARKKRKNRKKRKQTKLADTAAHPPAITQSNDDSGQQNPAETEGKARTYLITSDSAGHILTRQEDFEGLFVNGQRHFPLSEIVELNRMDDNGQLLQYTRTNGKSGFITKDPDLDRFMRQKERLAAGETERQAEKKRAKGKRKNKKVKEVMIRRKEPSDGLRRRLEDTKQQTARNQGSDPRKRFNEITGDDFEKAIPESQVNSPQDTDSSGFSTEDTLSSPEQAPNSPLRPAHFGMSRVPHRNRPMGEQRLVEEVEDSDDGASITLQYGDEGPPSISDDESQSTAS